MKIRFYAHGGSGNHGCEAIVRSTQKVLERSGIASETRMLYSYAAEEDLSYLGTEELKIVGLRSEVRGPGYYWAAFKYKYLSDREQIIRYRHKRLLREAKAGDVALSIGGDNYTYDGWPELLGVLNKALIRKKVKTVLWGCSLSEDLLSNAAVVEDMKSYSLITVRESLSYNLLQQAGIFENVVLAADPAFQLDAQFHEIPGVLKCDAGVVGINMSPLALTCGKESKLVLDNYRTLIRYILSETTMTVALVPHVVWAANDDRRAMALLYEEFESTGRIAMIPDMSCRQLKSVISQCRFFVGARTHATIAAYSTCVPSLTVGYSLKSKGIATDIFGTDDNYVIPVQQMQNPEQLQKGFIWLLEHESEIRTNLQRMMPSYRNTSLLAGERLAAILEK